MFYLELLAVLVLILLNGVLAMSELAIVSAKKVHLRHLADEGNKTAARALAFAEDTGRFLPTVQVGMTLIGILSGAFGAAALADYLADYLTGLGFARDNAEFAAVTAFVVLITGLTLVIGELVPKELALRRPEKMALFVTPVIHALSKIAWPAVWLLNRASRFVLWLIRAGDKPETTVTQQEVQAMIAEGADHGIFAEPEREMLAGVMLLADKPVRAFMMPRINVVTIDCDAPAGEVRTTLADHDYTRFPVRAHDDEHHVIGIAHTKDIYMALLEGGPLDLKKLAQQAPVFPETASALKVIESLRKTTLHVAVIVDEHGSFQGIITLTDLFAAIAGEFYAPDRVEPEIHRRGGDSWLIDGGILIERAFGEIGLGKKPEDIGFHTLAGFMLSHFNRVPKTGDFFIYKGCRFEVVDMDGHRIDKVAVERLPEQPD